MAVVLICRGVRRLTATRFGRRCAIDPVTWVYLIVMIVCAYLSYSNRPKPVEPRPAIFSDIEFPQFEEGTPQCVFFGDCWTEDWMVLAAGNFRTAKIQTDSGK